MPRRDQLEIISRSGAVAFHELDPARGITNIGRNPENDVIIDGPEVAPFHAVLDHRHKPYQVMTLTPEAKAVIGDQALLPNVAHELHNWDTIEIDGHVIVLIEDEAGEPASRPAAAPPLSTPAPTPGTEMSYWNMGKGPVTGPAPAPVTALTPLPQATTPLPMLPVDQPDEVIITDLSERQWIIDCEQTATCQLTIINGGDIVASFNVQVEGLDPSWVVIAPPQVNLNEGERATVAIALTPPRASTSRAGPHHFAISVSSPNYPGRISRRGATLTVNPYYDFTLGELSPRQQTVTWRKRTGRATLPIANKGNGDAAFRLDAEDDQRGCAFEFHLPNETGGQARQAELHLAPEEESVVSVLMTPTKRRVIGLRKHMYSLTFTTTLLQGTLTPRSVLGQLQSAALIGMGLLLLILATLAFLVVLIFQPYITNFTGPNNCTSDCVVRGGNSLLLSWRASPFVNLKIDHEVGAVDGPEGSRSITPLDTVTYRLTAQNFLTGLFPTLFSPSQDVTVKVEPFLPIIESFGVENNLTSILTGQSINLFWKVDGADSLTLSSNGVEQNVSPTDTGKINVKPEVPTTYQLVATNHYGSTKQALDVKVSVPTPTPLPLPVITQFDVAPLVITVGQTINLAWDVSNVDKVTIQGITGATEYPPKGNISQQPDKAGTIQYVLSAKNGQPGGDVNMIREVTVNPAPPPPVAPTIEYFTAAPAQVVNGFATNIKLSWSVTGDTTNIQIMGPDIGTITGLAAQDSLTVSSDKATLFNLTAFNGDLSANQIAQITGVDPTPTPPPTATPVPPPVIYYFKLLCNDGSDCSDVTRDDSTLVPLHTRYIVLGGSKVRFEWQLHGAVRVTFGSSTIPAVDVPAVNDTPSFVGDRLITTGDTYELKAYAGPDATSATASMFIDIVIQQPPAPPPPFNVDGTYAATAPITVTWSYNQSDIDNYKVVGFRVYRADVPSSNFVRVADYTDIPANKREWADPLSSPPSPTCGKAYYVVAVNLDTEGNPQESTPSTTSWYTPVCP